LGWASDAGGGDGGSASAAGCGDSASAIRAMARCSVQAAYGVRQGRPEDRLRSGIRGCDRG